MGFVRTNVKISRYGGADDGFINKQISDDHGNISDMVRIPKTSWKGLGIGDSNELFPAFIVDGKEVDALYFGQYEASVNDSGAAVSVKGGIPKAGFTFDESSQLCINKGSGWHMTTRLEWMAVALWCIKHSCQPLGNNDRGKDITENNYVTERIPDFAMPTGTGRLTWTHNGTQNGIWDMNGNVAEWMAGIRIFNGEVQVLSKSGRFENDAAILESSFNSVYWWAINGITGELVNPDMHGTTADTVKSLSSNMWGLDCGSNISSKVWNITCDEAICEKAQNILKALGLLKPDTLKENNGNYLTFNIDSYEPESLICSGGCFYSSDEGGVLNSEYYFRSDCLSDIGFRPAFLRFDAAD